MASEALEPKEGDVLPGAEIETIQPSWRNVLPMYLALLQDGNDKGKATARTELEKVCALADHLVEAVDLLLEAKPYLAQRNDALDLHERIVAFNSKLPRS